MASQGEASAPWHAAFPAPKDVELGALGRDEVLQMVKSSDRGERKFVLVDVRRNDHEVSISHHPTPTRHRLIKHTRG